MNQKLLKKFKAIICDVDGTLVTNEFGGKLSEKVKKTIIKSRGKITVGIASGRPLDRVTFIFDELGLRTPCIICGGSQIVDPVTREILWERSILEKDVKLIRKALKTLNAKIWVVDNGKEILYTHDMKLKKPMNFFIPKLRIELADALIEKFSSVPTLALTKVVAYHEGYVALQITHIEATKEFAVIKAAELMNLEKGDIIGVGDGYNDYPLFSACGFKVAVGNAVNGLKEKADYVSPSVNDDAVAHILEKFVLN